jgi:hypothetical protein
MKRIVFAISLVVSLFASGQPTPRLTGAQLQTSSASGGLSKTIRGLVSQSKALMWIGYAVPTESRRRFICCCGDNFRDYGKDRSCKGGCSLGSESGNSYFNSTGGSCVSDEPQTHVLVFLRVKDSKITQVRTFTPDCALDAKDVPVHWLTDVAETESVALLTSMARSATDFASLNSEGGALDAIALHKDKSADAALESFLVPQTRSKLREQAAFWVALERGHHGFEVLRQYIRTDSDSSFRNHLTFAISQSEDQEAVGELIRTAHQDKSGEVRGQALFWLAQKAGSKVAGEINDAIENDPDTFVKKKAVFALTQMPDNEGVPKLIEVASKNRNLVVRKEAIFWLGQTGDPRALDYIEQVLMK